MKSKIRVLEVMPEFGLAGAETMCENLVYQLQRSEEFEPVVVSLYTLHTPITDRLEERGVEIHYLDKKGGMDPGIIGKLCRLMKERQISIVHTHRYVMQYAIPAALVAGVKVRVHTVHNIATKEVDKLRRLLAWGFYHLHIVTPVAISPIIKQTIIDEYGLKADKVPVVFNGSDMSKCAIKKDYCKHAPFRIVHIGRFNPQKNHETIIRSVARLKDLGYAIHLDLVGGAGDEDARKEQVRAMHLEQEITFCGLQSDVYGFLEAADCFILPSVYEGMPVTLVEAMGCGMPIVASRVGGVPDMINDGEQGLLIQPTVEELTEAIIKLMENDDLRATLGRNALLRSPEFSAENMAEGYMEIYKKQISKQ